MFDGLNLAGKFGALVTYLTARFTGVLNFLDSINSALRDDEDGDEGFLRKIFQAIGVVPGGPTIATRLAELTSPTEVSGRTNLETISNRLERMHTYDGASEDRSLTDLWDMIGGFRQQVIPPTSPTIAELISEGLNKADTIIAHLADISNNTQNSVNELTSIRQRLGLANNGLSIAEQLQVIAECICELRELSFPTPVFDVPPSLVGHPCAEGGEVMMAFYPADWVHVDGTEWLATPSYINPTIADSYFLATGPQTDPSADDVTVLRFDPNQSSYLPEFFCTVVGTDQTIDQITFRLWNFISSPPPAGYTKSSLLSGVTNIGVNASGCENLQAGGIETAYEGLSLRIIDSGLVFPPTFVVVLYNAVN